MTDNQKSTINKINIVISLLVAFFAWLYVVYNFAPMKEVVYTDVPINYYGEDMLEYRGYELLEAKTKKVDVKINVRRTVFSKVSAEDIEVKADISKAVSGNNGISLEIIPPDYCELISSSTKSVAIEVGEYGAKERNNDESNNTK